MELSYGNRDLCSMKNKTTAGILALVFGWLGVHRFYLEQKGLGILYLLLSFTGISFFLGLIDGIVLLTMDEDKYHRKYNPEFWAAQRYEQQNRYQYGGPPPTTPRPEYAQPTPPPAPRQDPFRLTADQHYANYDFDAAMRDYRRSLNVDPRQPEVHFRLACLYSIHEDTDTSLYHLSQALEHGYYDFDEIERHDHLAYLRATPDYAAFKSNGYRIPAVRPAPGPGAEPDTLELSDDLITQIERLAKLKEEGILSDVAFQREKAKILRS